MQLDGPVAALRAALGSVIAAERRTWSRERELIEAQSRAAVAELSARIVGLEAEARERVAARLADVRDGERGETGREGQPGLQGEPGERGEAGQNGQDGRDGDRGEQGDPGERGPDGEAGPKGDPGRDGRDGVDGAPGAPGKDGEPGERGPEGLPGKAGEPGRDGVDGKDGRDGLLGKDGSPGRDGVDGKDGSPGRDGINGAPGHDGERGMPGEPGRLPLVCAWAGGIAYGGDVVTHAGGTYQALRDTPSDPGGEDWACLALPGRDAPAWRVRGTFVPDADYHAFDVVALNSTSFIALRDQPGPCPGDGWQMLAGPGRRGSPGETGRPGLKGERGEPAPRIVAWRVDADLYEAVPVLSDGEDGAALSLRELFERYAEEARA